MRVKCRSQLHHVLQFIENKVNETHKLTKRSVLTNSHKNCHGDKIFMVTNCCALDWKKKNVLLQSKIFSELLGEFAPLIHVYVCVLSLADTFISSSGGKTRPAGGLKRRKKTSHSSSAPRSKRQRLTTGDSRATEARDSYSSSRQRRKGGILKKTSSKAKGAGTRSEAESSDLRKKGQQQTFSKPVVRFADKKKRTLKGTQFKVGVGKTGGGGGGAKRRPGGQVFRRRAKAS